MTPYNRSFRHSTVFDEDLDKYVYQLTFKHLSKMANKNSVKPAKVTTPVVMTSDNVMDVINAKNLGSSEMATKIQEELKNEQDERIKEMKKTRFSRASFKEAKTLIDVRRRKREMEITKEELVRRSDFVKFLMGFEVTREFLDHHKVKGDEMTLKMPGKDNKLEDKKVKLGDKFEPCIDITDYDVWEGKINDDIYELRRKCDDQFDKEMNKVRLAFGEYYKW